MSTVLVWPPKRPVTIICLRFVGALTVAAWPTSLLYAAILDRHDPNFIAAMTLMIADAAPLVFVSMRTAMLFPRTVASLNRHTYVVVAMVLATFYGYAPCWRT